MDKVWEDFAHLPLEAQRQVADFVAFLRQRHQKLEATPKAAGSDLSHEPFVGIWQDRPEIEDSSAWVRDLREQEWKR